MDDVAVVGLDLAKNVFQVHAIAAGGGVLVRRQLRRGQVLSFFAALPPCLVGIEACASAHHWARELMARRRGRAQASRWHEAAHPGAAGGKPALEPGLRLRPDDGWAALAYLGGRGRLHA